jgi:hypothetical protein
VTVPSFSLEPEVEALIQEIARDPRSSFLKVPRPVQPRDLAGTWERFSSVSAGWTSAERHLLDAHREEVAYWMRTKVLVEVLELPGERDRVATDSVPSKDELRLRSAELLLRDAEDSGLASHLQRGASDAPWSPNDLYALARVSVQLAPTDHSWLRLSLTLHHVHHFGTAVQVLGRRLSSVGSDLMRTCFLCGMGAAYHAAGNHVAARDAYSAAASVGPRGFLTVSNALAEYLILGDTAGAARSLEQIDELAGEADTELERVIRLVKQSPALRANQETVRGTARKLETTTGPHSLKLLHAYL